MTIMRHIRKTKTKLKRRLGMKAPMAVVRFRAVEPPMSQKPQLPVWKLLFLIGTLAFVIYLQHQLRK